MGKIVTIGMVLLISLMAFLTVTTNLAAATTLYVDDDNCPGPGSGTLSDPYCTIQVAINAASPGDTIQVAAGTYNERLTINKPLNLYGAQYGVDPTAPGARTNPTVESIITEAGLPTPNPDVLIEIPNGVTDVVIDGFTLIGDPTNPVADTSVVRIWDDDITISNNIIDGKYNVLYKGADGLTVSQNRMVTNKGGVTVQPNSASNVIISDNTFALGSSPAGDEAAIYMTSTSNSSVTGNTASDFTGGGLRGSNNINIHVSGNSITENKDGFSFWGSTTFVTVSNNDLSGNTRYGINIKGQDITITGNDILNNGDTGINVDRHVIDTERVNISCNNIYGNTNYGVKASAAVTETVDAESNYWGIYSPIDIAAMVSGNVDWTPFTDNSCTYPFDPDTGPTEVWVDDDYTSSNIENDGDPLNPTDTEVPNTEGLYWGWNAFASIQDAIDAVSRSTVHVALGTYTEAVTIPPGADLKIIGAGRDATTWIAPTSNPTALTCNMEGNTGTTTLEIAGFTFNCRNSPDIIHGTGLLIDGASKGLLYLSIHDNRFIEDRASGNDTHWATSVWVCHNRYTSRDPDTGEAPVKIYNNIDETWGGICMSNSQAFDIYDNTFDGCNDAIYIGHGCPDVSGNTLDGHHIFGNVFKNASDDLHPGGKTPAIDIQYYGSGGATHLPIVIEKNLFQDNDGAIRFIMDTDMTYPAHIVRCNNFINNGMAIAVTGDYPTALNAEYNWWGHATGPCHLTSWIYMGSPYGPNPSLGDKVSDYVLYKPWKGSASWYKEDAIAELEAAKTGDKKVDGKIDKVIKNIEESLKDDRWIDVNHIDEKKGNKVFDDEKEAVIELMKLLDKDDTPQEVEDVCHAVIEEKLMKADEILATTVYEEAQAGVDDPKVDRELEKCEQELAKANEEIAKGNYDKAIDYYKKVWEHAQNALKHAP